MLGAVKLGSSMSGEIEGAQAPGRMGVALITHAHSHACGWVYEQAHSQVSHTAGESWPLSVGKGHSSPQFPDSYGFLG